MWASLKVPSRACRGGRWCRRDALTRVAQVGPALMVFAFQPGHIDQQLRRGRLTPPEEKAPCLVLSIPRDLVLPTSPRATEVSGRASRHSANDYSARLSLAQIGGEPAWGSTADGKRPGTNSGGTRHAADHLHSGRRAGLGPRPIPLPRPPCPAEDGGPLAQEPRPSPPIPPRKSATSPPRTVALYGGRGGRLLQTDRLEPHPVQRRRRLRPIPAPAVRQAKHRRDRLGRHPPTPPHRSAGPARRPAQPRPATRGPPRSSTPLPRRPTSHVSGIASRSPSWIMARIRRIMTSPSKKKTPTIAGEGSVAHPDTRYPRGGPCSKHQEGAAYPSAPPIVREPLALGGLPIPSRFFLAPLAGYTSLAFRLAVRELRRPGPGDDRPGQRPLDPGEAAARLRAGRDVRRRPAARDPDLRPRRRPRCATRRGGSSITGRRPSTSTWAARSTRSSRPAAARP